MASAALNQPQAIADRSEIHKSCRALENVVNVLNDYSEAARAVVTLQKKLTKALREASGLKANGEIACNAFGTSANIFDVLSDIDAKYAKIADKECDSVSGEVRKWFKKLAKEEKAHDDKIVSCNAKIKQAGQLYEKKAKKNTYDVAEEHSRYIALLSSLGPEITQEKYNHSLMVSQRNTAITYNVAATVSRIADAEWLRATEGVRRFSPLVGQLGEWRSFCEGGWTGALPEGLPDLETPSLTQEGRHNEQDSGGSPIPTPQQSPPGLQTLADSSSKKSDNIRRPTSLASLASFPSPPTHFPIPPVQPSSKPSTPVPSSPSQPYTSSPPQMKARVESRTGSDISAPSASLAKVEEEKSVGEATPALTDSSRSPASTTGALATPPSAASPQLSNAQQRTTLGLNLPPSVPEDEPLSKIQDLVKSVESSRTADSSTPKDTSSTRLPPSNTPSLTSRESEPIIQRSNNRAVPSSHPNANYSNPNSRTSSYAGTTSKGDYLEERELGIDRSTLDAVKSKSLDSGRGGSMVERSDTVRSSGSVVATMKDRIGRSTGPASPPPRDLPRLQLSVTEIATKFQAPATTDTKPSSRRPLSPMEESIPRRSYDIPEPAFTRSVTARPVSMQVDDLARRRQRVEEMEELERRERELEGRVRERERAMLEREAWDREELQAKEQILRKREGALWMEQDARRREGLDNRRTPDMGQRRRDTQDDTSRSRADGYASDTTRSLAHPPTAPYRPYSQASTSTRGYEQQSQAPSLASRYSYSTTNLAAPPRGLPFPSSPTSASRDSAQRSVSPSRAHDLSCQCPACTVERYAEAPLSLPAPPEREKKGWRRRLSMPVVISPFLSEARKDKGIMGGKGIGVGIVGQQNGSVTSFRRR